MHLNLGSQILKIPNFNGLNRPFPAKLLKSKNKHISICISGIWRRLNIYLNSSIFRIKNKQFCLIYLASKILEFKYNVNVSLVIAF